MNFKTRFDSRNLLQWSSVADTAQRQRLVWCLSDFIIRIFFITFPAVAENSILNQPEKATSVFLVLFIFPPKMHSSHCIADTWTYIYMECILVSPHFRLILSTQLIVAGKLISSYAGRVCLNTSHAMFHGRKDNLLKNNLHHVRICLVWWKRHPWGTLWLTVLCFHKLFTV